MSDLVKQARIFATSAHQRIDHRRKYTQQPYEVHLKAVAALVKEVGGSDEMIAAAWLHDTVEDTPATHHDIEKAFGAKVASLVYELTDVSKPSDGNRPIRKAIDRNHLAAASSRAQTIKLADLIDNARDICKHDENFARVYIAEMAALLDVLQKGNSELMRRARKALNSCLEKLGMSSIHPPPDVDTQDQAISTLGFSRRRVQRLFSEAFTAKDIAEPLPSFDGDRLAKAVRALMEEADIQVAGIRDRGIVVGYARREDLSGDTCLDHSRGFSPDQKVYGDANLSDVILVLSRHDYCFITLLNAVTGVITRADMEKPIVRMWLFGIITMLEIRFTELIKEQWPNDAWTERCSPGRLEKAKTLLEERRRRGAQHIELADCLQLSDKSYLLAQNQQLLRKFGFKSKSQADQAVRSLESLRNNLAHGQSITTQDWPQIVRISQRFLGGGQDT
ncbi:HD domain-containing protein [Thiolapillus sp.]